MRLTLEKEVNITSTVRALFRQREKIVNAVEWRSGHIRVSKSTCPLACVLKKTLDDCPLRVERGKIS